MRRGRGAFLAFLLTAGIVRAEVTGPRHVMVEKAPEGWRLLVDGQPFYVEGVGCNTAARDPGEDYMRMAEEMGANAVRTWGGAPRSYFDRAQKHGLMVDAGIWFNPIRGRTRESYQSRSYCRRLKRQALAYVHEFKNHPALLFWNLGNEVFYFTQSGSERRAFADFLSDLARAVHEEDPNHPIVYACHNDDDFSALKAYVPEVDVIGVNTYAAFSAVMHRLREQGLSKPVLVTEFGCAGPWDRPRDENGVRSDPPDQYKANDYVSLWRAIRAEAGQVLGGFAFVLGDARNQESVTWNNINFREMKRPAYWALRALYTGRQPPGPFPKITDFRVSAAQVRPGGEVSVHLETSSDDPRPFSYQYFVSDIADDPLVVVPPHYFPVHVEQVGPGEARVSLPKKLGIYRVYAVVSDDLKNAAVADASVRVKP